MWTPLVLLYTATLYIFGSTIQNSIAPLPASVVTALSSRSRLVLDGDLTSITSSGEPASHFSVLSSLHCLRQATSAAQTSLSGNGRYGYSVSTRNPAGSAMNSSIFRKRRCRYLCSRRG